MYCFFLESALSSIQIARRILPIKSWEHTTRHQLGAENALIPRDSKSFFQLGEPPFVDVAAKILPT